MTDHITKVCFKVKLPHDRAVVDALAIFATLKRGEFTEATESELRTMGIDAQEWDLGGRDSGFVVEPREADRHSLLISTRGDADLTVLSFFLQTLVKRWDPTGFVAFEFIHDSSQPKVNAYVGGAVFITASTWEVFNTDQWVQEKYSAFAFQAPGPWNTLSPK
jgi:hypothetical protein